jgi:hypothetical protein
VQLKSKLYALVVDETMCAQMLTAICCLQGLIVSLKQLDSCVVLKRLLTGTFKLKKIEYKKEGFNPYLIKDHMYYLDPKSNQYKPLDQRVYDDIVAGKIRF